VIVVRRGAIALALVAAVAVAGCGGKKKQEQPAELKGTVTFGVLAPTQRTGEIGLRGKDLIDGAQLAVAEINASGGVMGRKLQLEVVDDACDTQVSYEAAKAFLSDSDGVAGVIGGMCDEVTEREVSVIDSTGLPFLVTGGTDDAVISDGLQSTYWMTGTNYQQGLSSMFWMNYQEATRLAVVQDDSVHSKDLAQRTIAAIGKDAPKVVSLQTIEPDGPTVKVIARAAVAAKPDHVLWTGAAAAGGELLAALREAGYEGGFSATAASEDPAFLAAAGEAAEGAFVMATAKPSNLALPGAEKWKASFTAKYKREPRFEAQQGYDSVRVLEHAIERAKSTDPAPMLKAMTTIDPAFTNSMGVVRFAADHRLLYDNRVILKVKGGAFTWERSLRTDAL
jgi:branched-chain amino acid transport system substrate-binding protein